MQAMALALNVLWHGFVALIILKTLSRFQERYCVSGHKKAILMKTRARVLISGRVQGVWYRATTRDKAEQLGLTGWVRNTPDGKVEAVFEGEENDIQKMLLWCWEGPDLAKVVDVNINFEEYIDEFDSFKIVL